MRIVENQEPFAFLQQILVHRKRILVVFNRVLKLLCLLQQLVSLLLFSHKLFVKLSLQRVLRRFQVFAFLLRLVLDDAVVLLYVFQLRSVVVNLLL